MPAAASALRYSSKMGHLHCPREKAKKKPTPNSLHFSPLTTHLTPRAFCSFLAI